MHNTRLRDALFTVADARGNNPHGTRETAVHEGQRLNAQRYETVEQIDRALDARARKQSMPKERGASNRLAALHRAMGETTEQPLQPPSSSGGFWAGALLMGLGAGIVYLLMRKDESESGEGEEEEGVALAGLSNPSAPPSLPAPAQVVVVLPSGQTISGAASTGATPALVPAVEPAAEENPKKRKRSKKVAEPSAAVSSSSSSSLSSTVENPTQAAQ